MLKWLEKVLGSSEKPEPEKLPQPVPAKPVKAKPVEKPLPPPQISLDDETADDGSGFVARQVIINREYRLIGYEFSMREHGREPVGLDARSQTANDLVLVRAINGLGIEKLGRSRLLWVSVLDASLAEAAIESLPAASTVFVVRLHGHAADPALLARAGELKAAGYRLALANWAETAAHQAWLPLADYVVIDTAAYNPAEVGELARKVAQKAPRVEALARHVESFEEYEFCQRARYRLFQGGFLTKRENWPPQPKMSPDRTRICNLLNRLRAGDEITDVAAVLRQSPELSYRLLRYINSAAMGLPSRIASIERGLVFMGREKLYRWLTLLLFNADDTKSSDSALLEQGLVRGHMMETLGAAKFSRMQNEELFVVGIFSLLDVLLKQPMSVALNPLQLPPAVANALIDETGDYAAYLRLAVACEEQDAERLKRLAEVLGLSVDAVNAAHFAALAWAQEALAPDAGGGETAGG